MQMKNRRLPKLNQNSKTYLPLNDDYIRMFKNRAVDVITSIALLILALVVVDLTVLDFNLTVAVTNVSNALIAVVTLVIATMIILRRQ